MRYEDKEGEMTNKRRARKKGKTKGEKNRTQEFQRTGENENLSFFPPLYD